MNLTEFFLIISLAGSIGVVAAEIVYRMWDKNNE